MIYLRISLFAASLLVLGSSSWAQLLVAEQGVLLASDAEPHDHFARSVSLDGDTIAIGARDNDDECPGDPDCDSGSVYVYTRTGTVWSEQQKILAADASEGDDFGDSVALWGDTLVVGAPGVDASGINAGAVYVFTRTGTVWSQQGARLLPSNIGANDCLGGSVGLESDLLVAGARFHDGTSLFDSGSAYVYSRAGTTWTEEAELEASDATSFDRFGTSVHAGTNRVVIGSPHDDAPGLNSGSAYVFSRAGTVWSQEAKLTPTGASGSDEFGTSVSLDASRIVVGAPFADRTTVTPGAAFVFERAGTVWTETATLMSIDLDGNDRFGHSVDNRSGTIVVGASMDNHLGVTMGSTYVFEQTGTSWVQEAKVLPFAGGFQDEFGQSVSTDGNSIAVGSWRREDTAGVEQGAGYAFLIRRGVFLPFCYGDGGDQMGCRDCPCGNNAKQGSLGGCLNSVGNSGRVAGFGVPSVMTDTLRFEAVNCSPGTFGLLTSANNMLPAAGICPPGSGITQPVLLDGLRCAGGGFQRHGTRPTDANGSIGITTNGWGPPSPPAIGLIAQAGFTSGVTRHFQVIYRDDPNLVCGTALNTTNAVTVTMIP